MPAPRFDTTSALTLLAGLLVAGLLTLATTSTAQAEEIEITPTFHSAGIVWTPQTTPAPGDRASVCLRREDEPTCREVDGLLHVISAPDLQTNQRHHQLSGSLLTLSSNTEYEVTLTFGHETHTQTFRTWSNHFPVARVVPVPSSNERLIITEGGDESGYVLYEGIGDAIIDVGEDEASAVWIEANYVIVRGLTVRGGQRAGIQIGRSGRDEVFNDIVIEDNDVSGWGRDGGDGYNMNRDPGVGTISTRTTLHRVVIQRNKIHSPRHPANAWLQRTSSCTDPTATNCHPRGAQAITWQSREGREGPSHHVIRYNHITSENGNRFNDAMGGGANFSFAGWPGPHTDIYGNDISEVWDDAIEAEGHNGNVRIWNNQIGTSYNGIAIATTSVGPIYIFRNIRGEARVSNTSWSGGPLADDASEMYYGRMIKMAPRRVLQNNGTYTFVREDDSAWPNAEDAAGPIRIFHNTTYQPTSETVPDYPIGIAHAISAHQSVIRNVWTRNNIFQIRDVNSQVRLAPSNSYYSTIDLRNDFDYDLTNRRRELPAPPEGSFARHWDTHTYLDTIPLWDGEPGLGAPLAMGSPGFDDGLWIPGLNDEFTGAAPDRGAVEQGMPWRVGPNAGLLDPPVAIGIIEVIDITGDVLLLQADGSDSTHDRRGWIRTYSWRIDGAEVGTGPLSSLEVPPHTTSLTLHIVDNEGQIDELLLHLDPSSPGDDVGDIPDTGTPGTDPDAGSNNTSDTDFDNAFDTNPNRDSGTDHTPTAPTTGCACSLTPSNHSAPGLLLVGLVFTIFLRRSSKTVKHDH